MDMIYEFKVKELRINYEENIVTLRFANSVDMLRLCKLLHRDIDSIIEKEV